MTTTHDHLVGFLGPEGSWTHEAAVDLFPGQGLVARSRDELFADFHNRRIGRLCVPVTTSIVGVTPYLDPVLDLPEFSIEAEYLKMLGYSLLARPSAQLSDIQEVFAHPVAFKEVEPWLDRMLPHARRVETSSGGEAARIVATGQSLNAASFGPKIGAAIYGLRALVDGIEEGPHNVTRWWVLGRAMSAPTGNDKTSLLVPASDQTFAQFLREIDRACIQILTIYERPTGRSLDTHRYLVEVAGHARDEFVADFVAAHSEIRVLGSYARK